MRKIVLLSTIAMTLGAVANAQSADTTGMEQTQLKVSPIERTTRQLTMLTKKLSLTQDQVMQLRPILINENISLDSLRNHPSGKRRSDMQSRRQLMQDTDTKIEALLTDQQKPIYQQWKDEQKQKMMDRRRNKQTT